MFASDLSFSKAVIAERRRQALRRSAKKRIFWIEDGRPGARQAGGQGR